MNLNLKNFIKRHICIFISLLFVTLIFSFFYFFPNPKLTFREMTNHLFLEDITTDTLSLHYTLAYPSNYSITSYPLTLPRYDKDSLQQSYSKIENSLFSLSNMDRSALSEEELYCHNMLKDYFSLQKQGFSYTYLEECFSPSSGIVANYPILMAEYTFRTKKDIIDYLTLLADTPDYFDSFFQFQKERAKKGYFLASKSLQETIEQCDTIITEKSLQENSHFLQLTFRERLTPLLSQNIISKEDALKYTNQNNSILKSIVLPAYQNLKNNLQSLQTKEIPLTGLYKKEKGKLI